MDNSVSLSKCPSNKGVILSARECPGFFSPIFFKITWFSIIRSCLFQSVSANHRIWLSQKWHMFVFIFARAQISWIHFYSKTVCTISTTIFGKPSTDDLQNMIAFGKLSKIWKVDPRTISIRTFNIQSCSISLHNFSQHYFYPFFTHGVFIFHSV